jgi:hypothetical protein
VGDNAGSKKQKAEELGILVYEGRERIVEQFPLLGDLKKVINAKPQQAINTQQSLF